MSILQQILSGDLVLQNITDLYPDLKGDYFCHQKVIFHLNGKAVVKQEVELMGSKWR